MSEIQFITFRFNGWEYSISNQQYDWIRRSYTIPGTDDVDWDKLIKYFEENVRTKKEIPEYSEEY